MRELSLAVLWQARTRYSMQNILIRLFPKDYSEKELYYRHRSQALEENYETRKHRRNPYIQASAISVRNPSRSAPHHTHNGLSHNSRTHSPSPKLTGQGPKPHRTSIQ